MDLMILLSLFSIIALTSIRIRLNFMILIYGPLLYCFMLCDVDRSTFYIYLKTTLTHFCFKLDLSFHYDIAHRVIFVVK